MEYLVHSRRHTKVAFIVSKLTEMNPKY